MAQTPEAKVKAKVKKVLDTHGAYYFMPIGGPYSRAGVPDIVGSYKGKFFAIECKAGKGKPTALQLKEMIAINDSGARAIVVNEDNIDDVEKMLKGL
jgi:Holliday junction resolvase